MPKSIIVQPETVFARSTIQFSDIPVNAYQDDLPAYPAADLLSIWEDMWAIREFEVIVNEIKLRGTCQGSGYQHAAPAHLAIGQEAAAVGMAFALTADD